MDIERVIEEIWFEAECKHQQNIFAGMSVSPSREVILLGEKPSSPAKLSISTLYPTHLPKLDFYTLRAIHQDPSGDHRPLPQAPITYLHYLRSKHRRRLSTRTDIHISPTSMLVTNGHERTGESKEEWKEREKEKGKVQGRYGGLLEKVRSPREEREKDRQVKSTVLLNYYKKKFLKYRCRKSIDLQPKQQLTPNKIPDRNHRHFLADGLKIQKITVQQTPKKELINRAKFNTLTYESSTRRVKRWEIGPWNHRFQTEPWDSQGGAWR